MATQQIDLGNVKGPPGPTGPSGADGKSAYQAAVDGGYTGTEAQFNAQLNTMGSPGYVPTTRKVAGKALSADVTLTATDVGAAPTESPVFTGSISMGRNSDSDIGVASVAIGEECEATSDWSFAFGENCKAYAECAFAACSGAIASGTASFAEGLNTHANATAAHAEGSKTTASNYASHAGGKCSKGMTTGGAQNNTAGDVFVLGNGTGSSSLSNAFRVTYAGTVYGKGSFQTSGADYAEYFQWTDDNPEHEDRVGYFVTLEGAKIKLAQPGDYILGIVSANPCIIGNADEDWLGRQLHDQFGRFIKEYLVTDETEVQPPEGLEGKALRDWMLENDVEKRDGQYIQHTATVVDYETPSWRYKENPEYDPSQPYIERKDRPEWDAIGMLGVLAVRDDGTCQANGFCRVAEGSIATAADGEFTIVDGQIRKGYRVIERVAENIVKVVFRG